MKYVAVEGEAIAEVVTFLTRSADSLHSEDHCVLRGYLVRSVSVTSVGQAPQSRLHDACRRRQVMGHMELVSES